MVAPSNYYSPRINGLKQPFGDACELILQDTRARCLPLFIGRDDTLLVVGPGVNWPV